MGPWIISEAHRIGVPVTLGDDSKGPAEVGPSLLPFEQEPVPYWLSAMTFPLGVQMTRQRKSVLRSCGRLPLAMCGSYRSANPAQTAKMRTGQRAPPGEPDRVGQ